MGTYEDLLVEHDYIEVRETDVMPNNLHGLWLGDLILINRNISETQKLETLHEELSHNKLTHGDILNQSSFNNRKFENYAKRYAYESALPLDKIISAYKQNISNLFELSEFVQLSEDYVSKVLDHYKSKYGQSVYHNNHLIVLDPLQVFEYKDVEDK